MAVIRYEKFNQSRRYPSAWTVFGVTLLKLRLAFLFLIFDFQKESAGFTLAEGGCIKMCGRVLCRFGRSLMEGGGKSDEFAESLEGND